MITYIIEKINVADTGKLRVEVDKKIYTTYLHVPQWFTRNWNCLNWTLL